MSGVLRVARAEVYRLLRVRAVWITTIMIAVASAVTAWASHLEALREGVLDPIDSGSGWAPLVDGWRAGLVLGVFVTLAHAARSLAGDRESGVIRFSITRSASRSHVLLGRFLAGLVLILPAILVTGAAAYLVAWRVGDFGPFVEDGFEIIGRSEIQAELFRAVISTVPAWLALYAFGLAVSCMAGGATSAVTTALGLFVAFDLLKGSFGDWGLALFASHLPTLADSSAWAELPGLVRGYSDAWFDERMMRVAWTVPWPALVLVLAVGDLALRRRAL